MIFHLMHAFDSKLVRQWQWALWLIAEPHHPTNATTKWVGIFWCPAQFTRTNSRLWFGPQQVLYIYSGAPGSNSGGSTHSQFIVLVQVT